MAKVTVEPPGHRYSVLIGRGALQELAGTIAELNPTGVAMITDDEVHRHWGEAVEQTLSGAGIACPAHVVANGEGCKSYAMLQDTLTFLERTRIDRKGLVIALGGGTVGDLAGFAASIWLRGVRHLQVPTTLLAMVDSSVGGKTGINTATAKNAIGAFWQPAAVVADLAMLDTLPDAELTSAFAECIKYGIAMDADLAATLTQRRQDLQARHSEALEAVVARCVELKAEVVKADEREAGARAILNYGHTVGHAIEACSGYRAAHGRAVAQGMRVAARLGARTKTCEPEVVTAQDELLLAYGLPGPLPETQPEDIVAALQRDKKTTGGRVGWVLPRRIGRTQVGVDVPTPTVRDVLDEVWAR